MITSVYGSNSCFSERDFIYRTEIFIQILKITRLAYHGGIVRCERERRNIDRPMIAFAIVNECLSERTIGTHTSGYRYLVDFQIICGFFQFAHQNINDGSLERGAHVFAQVWHFLSQFVNRLYSVRFEHVAEGIEEGCFETGE